MRLEMTNLLYDYAVRMGEGRACGGSGRMRLEGMCRCCRWSRPCLLHQVLPDRPHTRACRQGDNVQVAMTLCADGVHERDGLPGDASELLTYYSQYTGDCKWFENRNALRQEYSLMVTDNVGSAMGGWSPSHPFAARLQ